MRVERGEVVKEGVRALELASFPTANEWNIWLREHKQRLEEHLVDGWELAVYHAIGRLMDNQLTLARMIRAEGEGKIMMKYNADGQIIGEETRSSEDITREAFNWWLNVPRPVLLKDGTTDTQPGLPEWLGTLAQAVEGCYIQQCRLGMELTAIKRTGYLTLNASATKQLPTEKALKDKGMAAFGSFSDRDREDV